MGARKVGDSAPKAPCCSSVSCVYILSYVFVIIKKITSPLVPYVLKAALVHDSHDKIFEGIREKTPLFMPSNGGFSLESLVSSLRRWVSLSSPLQRKEQQGAVGCCHRLLGGLGSESAFILFSFHSATSVCHLSASPLLWLVFNLP